MIKSEIDAFIKRVVAPAIKELTVVKAHDWSIEDTIKKREYRYKLQKLLTDRAIKHMAKLYKIAERRDELGTAKVKNAMKVLREYYLIMDARYTRYSEDISWMHINDDDPKAVKRQEDESVLRSNILDHITSLEDILRSINDGGESNEVDVPLNKNTPVVPLAMRVLAIKKFPKIKVALKNLEDE